MHFCGRQRATIVGPNKQQLPHGRPLANTRTQMKQTMKPLRMQSAARRTFCSNGGAMFQPQWISFDIVSADCRARAGLCANFPFFFYSFPPITKQQLNSVPIIGGKTHCTWLDRFCEFRIEWVKPLVIYLNQDFWITGGCWQILFFFSLATVLCTSSMRPKVEQKNV